MEIPESLFMLFAFSSRAVFFVLPSVFHVPRIHHSVLHRPFLFFCRSTWLAVFSCYIPREMANTKGWWKGKKKDTQTYPNCFFCGNELMYIKRREMCRAFFMFSHAGVGPGSRGDHPVLSCLCRLAGVLNNKWHMHIILPRPVCFIWCDWMIGIQYCIFGYGKLKQIIHARRVRVTFLMEPTLYFMSHGFNSHLLGPRISNSVTNMHSDMFGHDMR